jgi:ribosomal-protein-alanine N-acetyltransferase
MTWVYKLRHMRLEDIPRVLAIDEISFTSPWSESTYQYEVNHRDTSHMVILEAYDTDSAPSRGLRGVLGRLRKSSPPPLIIGYGGCWLIAGEAHVSTIAVHPDFRGKGLGELLLASMLQRAIYLNGEYSVLEVRAGNETAQELYNKYEYRVVGTRKGYYRDDGEDALLMEVRPLDEAYQQRLNERVAALSERVHYIDRFSHQLKP